MKTNFKTNFFQAKQTQRLFLAVAATTSVIGSGASMAVTQTTNTPAASTRATTATVAKPPQVGKTAPDFQLKSISGEAVRLSKVAEQGPVVLVMLRSYPGYQCPFCTVQVGQLMSKAKQFADAKTRVLLVYPGPGDGLKAHADEFVKGKDMPKNFDLLLDPNYAFTNLYGLRWDSKGEISYPSTFVLDNKRKVLFAKISHGHGDRAEVGDVLAALPK